MRAQPAVQQRAEPRAPVVTVVLVADGRGSGDGLQRALTSVLCQRNVDLEALVIATEPFVHPIVDDPRVRVLCPERLPGLPDLAAARNAGVAAGRGRWVAFLNAEEVWSPDVLSAHLAALEERPDAGWSIAGSVSFTASQGTVQQIQKHWSPTTVARESFCRRLDNQIPTISAVVVERDRFEALDGLNPEAGIDPYWDLWIRLADSGPAALVDRPLVATRLPTDGSRRPPARPRRVSERLSEWSARAGVPLSWRAEAWAWLPSAVVAHRRPAEAVDGCAGEPAAPSALVDLVLVDLCWSSLPGVHQVTAPGAVEVMMQGLARGQGGTVITPNLHHLWTLRRSPELARCYQSAALIVSDGAPLVWASRLRGQPVPERVAGSDLVWFLAAAAAQRGVRLFLLGGLPGSAEATAEQLSDRFPGLVVAGTACPPCGFEQDPEQMTELEHELRLAQPDIVLVALGAPKQEQLAQRLLGLMPGVWFVGVGGAFEMASGQVRRAPAWIASLGMEWAYRLAQEPRRLAQRYLVHDLPVALRLLGGAARAGAARGAGAR